MSVADSKHRLGELIDVIGSIGLGDAENRSKDFFDSLDRVYEYFLTQFASAERKNGGQFYSPRCVVRVLVGMLAPYKGLVYDPCCGSAGMFVQSEKFVEEHGTKPIPPDRHRLAVHKTVRGSLVSRCRNLMRVAR